MEDEFDELRVAILFRCVDLFPDRLEFGSLLRLYGQYVHRYRLFLLVKYASVNGGQKDINMGRWKVFGINGHG